MSEMRYEGNRAVTRVLTKRLLPECVAVCSRLCRGWRKAWPGTSQGRFSERRCYVVEGEGFALYVRDC